MKDLLTIFNEYESTYSEPNIRSKGREDGEKNIPSPQFQSLSPYESEIVHGSKLVASKVVAEYHGKLEEIDAEVKGALDKATRKLQDDEARIKANYDSNKAQHDQRFQLRAARDAYDQAKKRFDIMFSKVGRMPIEYVPHWLYVVFATIIFLGEIPLNAIVFQIFGENQVMTWVMAFVIGLSIPLSSHFIGIKAREHEGKVNYANVIKALAVTAILVIALHDLSQMRHDYLLSMKDALGLDDRLVETSYLFFWLNLAVFGAAIILSYLSHDPIPGYRELQKEYENSQRRLAKEEAKKSAAIQWVENARSGEIEKARSEYREALEDVFKKKGEYDRILIEGRENEARCQHQMMRDISVYRHENIRARNDSISPPCFNIQVDLPMGLVLMREKLLNEEDSRAS